MSCPIFRREPWGEIFACQEPEGHEGHCMITQGGKRYAIAEVHPSMREEFAATFLRATPEPLRPPRDPHDGIKELFEAWWDNMKRVDAQKGEP